MANKITWVRTIYIYLFSLVGLVLVVIAGVRFIDMGLKAWVFTEADSYISYDYARPIPAPGEKAISQPTAAEQEAMQKKQANQQRQRDASNSLAMLIVGLPLYLYHWRMAGKQKEDA